MHVRSSEGHVRSSSVAPVRPFHAGSRLQECVPVLECSHDRNGNHFVRAGSGSRILCSGNAGVHCGLARTGAVEWLSAAAIRHRRVSRALVRGLPRAEPFDGIRALSPHRGGSSFLARARPAGRMHDLGNLAGAARVRTWHRAMALGRHYCRPFATHCIAGAEQHAADRHFYRGGRPFASSCYLSSLGPSARRAPWAVLAHCLCRGDA